MIPPWLANQWGLSAWSVPFHNPGPLRRCQRSGFSPISQVRPRDPHGCTDSCTGPQDDKRPQDDSECQGHSHPELSLSSAHCLAVCFSCPLVNCFYEWRSSLHQRVGTHHCPIFFFILLAFPWTPLQQQKINPYYPSQHTSQSLPTWQTVVQVLSYPAAGNKERPWERTGGAPWSPHQNGILSQLIRPLDSAARGCASCLSFWGVVPARLAASASL